MFSSKGFPHAFRAPVRRALTSLAARIPRRSSKIDFRLRRFLGTPEKPAILRRDYPNFAFPDFHYAVRQFLAGKNPAAPGSTRPIAAGAIASDHAESLTALLCGVQPFGEDRTVNSATKRSWKIDFEREEYFPLDCFWLVAPASGAPAERIILRLKRDYDPVITIVEVAAPALEAAERAMEDIRALATSGSIYLNKTMELAFPSSLQDDYGDKDGSQRVELTFRAPERLAEREVVLDPSIRDLIQELIFDFDAVAARLPFHNIGKKRGVLFYGPPGTGKTHTTKFILSRLEHRTRLVCSGKTLRSAKAVANVARMFSPAVVVLEDADLVFTNREINADNNNLGEFMDVLDGFARDDDVIFVLNTNSLDRMEDAIKNRPGRISQCIYMGAPGEALRAVYIERLLELHHARLDGMEKLVRRTEGCTQAFLKELVQRMIQRQLGATGPSDPEPIALTEAAGLEVLASMRSSGGDKGSRLIGFASGA